MSTKQKAKLTAKNGNDSSESSPPNLGFATGVSAENYAEKAKAHMVIHSKDGEELGVMIYRDKMPIQWRAWENYFYAKKIKHAFMKQAEKYMVPADWPHNFDAEWNA